MTRLVGSIRQIGLVVRDADAAMRHWANIVGVGPFMVFRDLIFEDYLYRGRPAPAPCVTIAVGHSGGLQVEIIQQHNDAPSAYRDFLAAGREGFQHVSSWFDAASTYEAARARLLEVGLEVAHEGRARGSNVRFAYFSDEHGTTPMLEISEALKPGARNLSRQLETWNDQWDGQGHVLEAPPRG